MAKQLAQKDYTNMLKGARRHARWAFRTSVTLPFGLCYVRVKALFLLIQSLVLANSKPCSDQFKALFWPILGFDFGNQGRVYLPVSCLQL